MGRPRDQFAWDQVEGSSRVWKCKYCCKEYSGASSRIRDHLSGQGNDIAACAAAPDDIRNEALKKVTTVNRGQGPLHKEASSGSITGKRGREYLPSEVSCLTDEHGTEEQDLWMTDNYMSRKDFFTEHVLEDCSPPIITDIKEELRIPVHVSEVLMKLIMLHGSSPVITDATKDPCFKEFLETIEQYGSPSTLNLSTKSLISIEKEVYSYMLMVSESWKTTGCALTVYDLKFSSKLEKGRCLFGLYCPKGIIFGEAPHPNIDFEGFKFALTEHRPSLNFEEGFKVALTEHRPSLNFEDATTYVLCHDSKSDDWTSHLYHAESLQCFRHEIQGICIDTCMESDWAKSLIDTAVKYHEQICRVRSLREGYYEILEENGNSFKDLDSINSMSAFRLSTFLSFTRLGLSLISELSKYILRSSLGQDVTEPLEAIYQDAMFWEDGCTLQELVTDVLRVSDRMDTLTPAIGYLKMAIEQVGHRLHSRSKSEDPILRVGAKLITFWEMLDSKVRGSIEGNSRDAASYLNPEYYIQQQCVQDDLQLQGKMKKALIKYIFTDFNRAQELLALGDHYGGQFVDNVGDWEDFIAEVRLYGHVIKRLLDKHGLQPLRHPLKLWEEFGDGLPILRRCAIRLLSQPVTCMCKQVKKLMLDVKGADDYILRLNLRMMHEFKMLGDGIYKPLDFSEWINRSLQGRIPEERAVTIRSSKAPAVQNDASEQSPKGTGPPNKFDMNMEGMQGKKGNYVFGVTADPTARANNLPLSASYKPEDVQQHMLMLKESWKTSGCTLMLFRRTFSSPVHTNVGTCVVGFYCPKGIIFMEAPHPDTDFQGFMIAMKQHEPSLDFDDATSYLILRHNVNSEGVSGKDWTRHVKKKFHLCRCLRDEIQEICIDRCTQSEWAEDMIKNAVEIHEKLCRHEILRLGYYEILEINSESFTDFDNTKGMQAIRLSIFLSIMRLNFDLREKLLNYIKRNSLDREVKEDLEVIFIDSNQYDIRKFWDQGRKLQLIFTFILKLLDLMDTLAPTSGILAMALDMVEYKLCGGGDDPILKEGDESFTFWKEIEPELRGTIEDNYIRKAAMYMNPLYCTRLRNISQRSDQENIQGPQLQTEVIEALIKFVSVCETEVERDVLIEQVQLYDNVFSEVFEDDMKRRNDHALKLWEEHGCELPLLQKHAITLLSQPLNCMCKQVKKHMYELNGADDYILRLNVRMMQEFKLLSDDICSPTGVLFGGWLTS